MFFNAIMKIISVKQSYSILLYITIILNTTIYITIILK